MCIVPSAALLTPTRQIRDSFRSKIKQLRTIATHRLVDCATVVQHCNNHNQWPKGPRDAK